MKKAAVKLTFLSTVCLIASATCIPVQGVAGHGVTALSCTSGTPCPKPTPGPIAPDGTAPPPACFPGTPGCNGN